MTPENKYIELLVQMLAIPSLSRREDTRAGFLKSWFKSAGLKVKMINNNIILSQSRSLKNVKVILNSHIDTVAPGEGWDSDPYLPVKGPERIIGLGSNDAGASVVSLAGAYFNLLEKNLADDVALVLSAEEEVSGKDGITSVLPEFQGLRFAVVGEPTGMQPAVAERGLMVLDGTAKGVAGHAARGEGVNAIYKAISDIERIKDIRFEEHSRWLNDPSVNVTMIEAGTGHNVVPAKCTFVVDVRSNDVYSNERLYEIIKVQCSSEIKPRSMRLRSSSIPEKHPLYDVLKKMDLKPFGSPTLSDMALISIPSVKIGPGDSARSHTANEYIFIHEIEEAITIYTKLIPEILKLKL